MYFILVTLSTVGYGDLVPETDSGRLFSCFFVPVGIILLLNTSAQVGGIDLKEVYKGLSDKRLANSTSSTSTTSPPPPPPPSPPPPPPPPPLLYLHRS
jgi:hypothetical protein